MEEMGVKSQELTLLQQERDKLLAELTESHLEVSRVTESKDDLKRSMARLKTSHAKELDKLHKRLRGGTWSGCIHLSLLWIKKNTYLFFKKNKRYVCRSSSQQ